MNEEKNLLKHTEETLKDDKTLACLAGLVICAPCMIPSYVTLIPVLSSFLVKCGCSIIGGVVTYVTMDVLSKSIKK